MPRVVNEDEYALRRNEILDAAQRLICTTGYEQVSIQDLVDVLGISKGAFYHYFSSKPDLLEALTERIEEESFSALLPILSAGSLSALEKIERFFHAVASWKSANKVYLMALLQVWYADDNAIVRQKMIGRGLKRLMPLLADVFRQGEREGLLRGTYTESTGSVLISLMVGMGDGTAQELLRLKPDSGQDERKACLGKMEETVKAYTLAIELILGAAPGSIHFFDLDSLREWVEPLEPVSPADTRFEKEKSL